VEHFLSIAFGYPTIVFSVLAVMGLVYWAVVFLGALDIDSLDVDSGGHAHGDVGHAHGDIGDAEIELGHGHGDVEAGEAGDGGDHGFAHAFASVLSVLRLRNAPLTVTLSVLTLFGWLLSYFGTHWFGALGPAWLTGTLTLLAALAIALPLTSLVTRPLGGLFRSNKGQTKKQLIGKTVKIRVHAESGELAQAELEGGVLLRIRSEDKKLERGANVLLVAYDEASDTFDVEPMDDLLARRREK
jgi:hypothetical protein